MNKNLICALAILIASSLIISSCKKEKDTEVPTITIAEPAAGDTIAVNDKVHIEFSVKDNEELHEITVKITDSTGMAVYSDDAHVDNATYSYHEHFEPSGITGVSPMTLTVTASDHSDNTANKSVSFFVKP